jgi:YD repeat-containing protein
MFYRYFVPALFLLAFSLSGCEKDEPAPNEQNDEPGKHYRLKSINYETFNATGTYFYNNDSTLKQIYFTHNNGSYSMDFTFQSEKVSTVAISNSLYKSSFQYNDAGRVISIHHASKDGSRTGHRYVFSYHADGRVKEMKYYDGSEAGDKLIYTNTYEYNSGGQLEKVVSVHNQNTIIFAIESYSEQCSFNPWTFIDINLSELYQIYNYPVLSMMKSLPKKITQTNVIGGTSRVVKIYETQYTITAQRLIKSVASIFYPENPQYNSSSVVSYQY